jgi:spore coat polysaccharide biosynthesis protein SpsF
MLCIVQARMSSKRFRGKMLENLSGVSILESVVRRLKLSNCITKIIIATSVDYSDDRLAECCTSLNLNLFRGSLENVASRFRDIIVSENAPSFLRISGDSPLIDPVLIDKAIELYNSENFDLLTNVSPRTFPKGQSIEILKSATFLSAYNLMKTSDEFEHVTTLFYSKNDKYKIFNLIAPGNFSDVNLCVDNPEDIKFLEMVLDYNNGKPAPWIELANLYRVVKSKFSD